MLVSNFTLERRCFIYLFFAKLSVVIRAFHAMSLSVVTLPQQQVFTFSR